MGYRWFDQVLCTIIGGTKGDIKAKVGMVVRVRGKELALAWKGEASPGEVNTFEVLQLLHLVAGYGLRSEFYLYARLKEAVRLCGLLYDLIQKSPSLEVLTKGCQEACWEIVERKK